MKRRNRPTPASDPLWFKDAIIYEIHVRAFADSNADGIGDFRGLETKLDYLQDLGVTALWLLPFYPSPLRDGGYDIADYRGVNPAYGSLEDFKRLLAAAHQRGIRIITELVINHTSSDHPWFQRARSAPRGSKWRDFYVWSDTPERYSDARITFKDFESSNWTWDPVAKQYYWHRFYSHQPDLNFDNPAVHKAVFQTLEFWLELGVDGLRLDAIPYLYERDGTNCENLPETHVFLKQLRQRLDARFENRMLLAEANQWPEDAAAYFGEGDECHMNFHFPVMPRMFMSVQLESSFPIIDIMEQTPEIPANTQWALFLRNHDELTLEMVTDEDRDYMYPVYADDRQARNNLGIRRRLAPLLGERRKIELLQGLLFSLPGTPVLYYGDEIGMGDNVYLGDRDGVRTPMQWSGDRNAGFSRANPQKLYLPVIIDPEYHYEAVNVEAQQNNPSSLLWWLKRLIALRKLYQVFGRGTLEFVRLENSKVLSFLREYQDERVLVVANLSRFVQYAELDLSRHAGLRPVELFGQTELPEIDGSAYPITLGPHEFYWFALRPARTAQPASSEALTTLHVERGIEDLFVGRNLGALLSTVRRWLPARRWFRAKSRKLRDVTLRDRIPLQSALGPVQLCLVDVQFVDGARHTYVLPLGLLLGERATSFEAERGHACLARLALEARGELGLLVDATQCPELGAALLSLLSRKRSIGGKHGQLRATPYSAQRAARARSTSLTPWLPSAEQTNTSVVFGDALILKLYRLVESGLNPDVELGRALNQVRGYQSTPAVAGVLEYQTPENGEPMALGLLQEFVANQGDAWKLALDSLGRFFERVLSQAPGAERSESSSHTPLVPANDAAQVNLLRELMGPVRNELRLLGQRTAEMHVALASVTDDPAFAPEAFSTLHQRSLYQSARGNLGHAFEALRRHLARRGADLGPTRQLATTLLGRRDELDARLKRITRRKLDAVRIRCHNDLHLGQVLFTGKDFYIIDFEGEPARPLSERRYKRSPLRDVAGMLRSLDYAAWSAIRAGHIRPNDVRTLEPWANAWSDNAASEYLDGYLAAAKGSDFLPQDPADRSLLLDFYLLEKCIYEVAYELDNRPDWLPVPLAALERLLTTEAI